MQRDSIMTHGARAFACLLLAAAGQAHAQQGASMEERLRNQLRATTAQLQEAQNELAQLKAGRPAAASGTPVAAAGGDAEALRKEVVQLKSQLASERSARHSSQSAQQSAQAEVTKAGEQVTQYRNAYDGLLKIARSSETERQRLAGEEQQRKQALAMCGEKNVKLYETGQEILRAYETMDIGTVMASRQPFATSSRVKYEQIAQEYGDKLYEGRFDARAAQQAAPAGAAVPAQAQ